MVMRSPFDEWLPDVTADSITVNGDVDVEARQNMWSFSLTPDQIGTLKTDDVVQFIEAIITSRSEQINKRHLPKMVIYCWYDEMANQLRFSMVSVRNGVKLPFRCPVNSTDSITDVVSRYLTLGGSSRKWSECSPEDTGIAYEAEPDMIPKALDVYATILAPFKETEDVWRTENGTGPKR